MKYSAILAALAGEPRHGYGVIQEVAARSSGRGRGRLRPGTLYTALDCLVADGLVAVDREEVVANRLRRYYRLTADGAAALIEEGDRRAAAARVRFRQVGVTA